MSEIDSNSRQRERFRGCLLGLAIGDAIGASTEFSPKGSFDPVEDMVGGGVFGLPPGCWTDDTSMALCLATSLVECRGFDAVDQMRRYLLWAREGYLSSVGYCFDIGKTVLESLLTFETTGNPYAGPTDPRSAGNGCIMRLAPIPIFFYPDFEKTERYAVESARTTHGTQECLDATRLFARILFRALAGQPKEEVLEADAETFQGSRKIVAIARGEYCHKRPEDLRTTGYVVDTLETALWCFRNTEDFEEAILVSANLGGDADTISAVCGQVAGAYYGESAIPKRWLENLYMGEEIRALADQLRERAPLR
ncbi:MAG: ADP-ribosylglycohydrolase family protein [Fimbriimonadales bacterium]|nr:ADP-ribosylglycohydrolase family protein [Fimbriimonadales bacterium]